MPSAHLRCDCRDQLETALMAIGKMPNGILLYLRQEGRGIGFLNKIRAYGLQDYGLDTVEANLALGFRDDERDYSVAAHMLMSLKVKSVRLMTNNPKKIGGLVSLGVKVSDRIPAHHAAEPVQPVLPRDQAGKVGTPPGADRPPCSRRHDPRAGGDHPGLICRESER